MDVRPLTVPGVTMKDLKTTNPIREGFRAVTPYLFVQNASRLIEFIAKAFGGSEVYRKERPDGAMQNQFPNHNLRSVSLNGIVRVIAPFESRTRISPERKHARVRA